MQVSLNPETGVVQVGKAKMAKLMGGKDAVPADYLMLPSHSTNLTLKRPDGVINWGGHSGYRLTCRAERL